MTQVLMAIRIAHRALRRNTLRSALTMLGVIIGVAAVIAMLAIGQGAQAAIRAQIASLGSHSLVIQPGSMTQSGVRYGWGSRTTLRALMSRRFSENVQPLPMPLPCCAAVSRWCIPTRIGRPRCKGRASSIPPFSNGHWLPASGLRRRISTLPAKWRCWGRPCGTMLFGSVDPVGQVMQIGNHPVSRHGRARTKGAVGLGTGPG